MVKVLRVTLPFDDLAAVGEIAWIFLELGQREVELRSTLLQLKAAAVLENQKQGNCDQHQEPMDSAHKDLLCYVQR